MVVLGGGAVSDERGTPVAVQGYLEIPLCTWYSIILRTVYEEERFLGGR